jgi:hypothetical protein
LGLSRAKVMSLWMWLLFWMEACAKSWGNKVIEYSEIFEDGFKKLGVFRVPWHCWNLLKSLEICWKVERLNKGWTKKSILSGLSPYPSSDLVASMAMLPVFPHVSALLASFLLSQHLKWTMHKTSLSFNIFHRKTMEKETTSYLVSGKISPSNPIIPIQL